MLAPEEVGVVEVILECGSPLKAIREAAGVTKAAIARARGVTSEAALYAERAGDATSVRLVRETAAAAWGCPVGDVEVVVRSVATDTVCAACKEPMTEGRVRLVVTSAKRASMDVHYVHEKCLASCLSAMARLVATDDAQQADVRQRYTASDEGTS